MNMQPPLQRTANQLSDYGRFGDSTLVHMNPAEVRGLASMSPTGELTINPVTGQPEAFLPFLAPLIGSWLGTTALGGTALGMAGAGALGAGLATWAESGSFEKGLISGVTGFGLGQIFKGGVDAANLGTELANVGVAQQTVAGAGRDLIASGQTIPNLGSGGFETLTPAMEQAGVLTNITPETQGFLQASSGLRGQQAILDTARAGITPGQRAGSLFSREGLAGIGQQLKNPAAIMPLVLGAGTRANVEQQEYMEDLRKQKLGEQGAKNRRFEGILHDAREVAGRTRGTNPYSNPFKAAEGGLVGYQGGGQVPGPGEPGYDAWLVTEGDPDFLAPRNRNEPWSQVTLTTPISINDNRIYPENVTYTSRTGRQADLVDAQEGILKTGIRDGEYFIDTVAGSGAEQQSFLRGAFEQQPPPDYRHGFEKEFEFFEHTENPELDRMYDLFGGGASDYLAGMFGLTPEQLQAYYDSVEGISADDRPLSSYDDITTQFSGVTGGIDNTGAGVIETTAGDTTITAGDPKDTTTIFSGTDPLLDDPLMLQMFGRWRDGEMTVSEIATRYGWSEDEALSILTTWQNLPTNGTTPETLTCYNDAGQSFSVTGVNLSCPAGWSETAPTDGGTETTITCYNETGESQSVTGVNPSCPVGWSETDPTTGGTETTITCYNQETGESQSVTGVNPSCPTGWSETAPTDGGTETTMLQMFERWNDGEMTLSEIATLYGWTETNARSILNTWKRGQTGEATPAWEAALYAITPPSEIDDDYSQTEIDEVVSLIDSGADTQQIAEYYNMTVDELMGYYNTIKTAGSLQATTPSNQIDDDYSQTEINSIVSLIDSGADTQQIADYYNMSLDELMGYYNAIKAGDTTTTTTTTTDTTDTVVDDTPAWELALNDITAAVDVDDDYSEAEIDAVWNLYMDGGATAKQIADYYGMSETDFKAYANEISAAKAGDVSIDTSTIAGAATVPAVGQGQIDTIIGDTTTAGVSPGTGAWDTSYIGDEGGTLEAASATAEYENREAQEQSIRDYVTSTYGEPPYTQEQALDFAADAIAGNVAAETVASALDIPLATIEAFYEMAGSTGDDIELGAGGGRVGTRRFMTSLGPIELANGGIADLPVNPEIMQPMEEVLQEEFIVEEEPYVDYPQLIEMTVEAIKGNVEDADAVINQFIEEYGIEKFQMLRDAVLKLVAGNPEAQTEGMIVGTGGGMDDEVMGVIGEQQDIAVSPDEYIVAADVVSGLGDGSSQAGADILDQVAANVRAARSGGRQPAPIDLSKVMSV